MADPKKMSVEEVLAACRRLDGGEGSASPEDSDQPQQAEQPQAAAETPKESPPAAQEAAQEPAKPAASGKSASEMSVAEILAAARGEKSGDAAPAESNQPEAKPKPTAADAGGRAAPSGKQPAKKPGEMSVADILAAARGEKSAKPAEKAPAKAAKPKPAAKASPAAEAKQAKESPKPAHKPAPTGPLDTQSILAAARKEHKRGPVSKSEVAAQETSEKKARPTKPKLEAPPMPAKPAYAKPEPAKSEKKKGEQDRRGFFAVLFGSFLATGMTVLGLTHLIWLLAFLRYLFPNVLAEPPMQFKVGFPGDFAADTVETKYKAQYGVWVVNTAYEGEPQIFALKSVCTHLGCTPNWLEGEQKFKCPCHGSGFYIDGINFEGPAPRPLERYAVRLAADGQIEVDKSQVFQQELGQWSSSESYVPV